MDSLSQIADTQIDALHEIGRQIAAADHFHPVLERVLTFTVELVKCDSCFIYVLSGDELVLRASKNPHADLVDRLKLRVGEGITGWVAEHREPITLSKNSYKDPRFQSCHDLPEDNYEALLSVPLLSRGRVVGVMTLQHRQQHTYSQRQNRLISTMGFLVGAEIEMARLEAENANLSQQLETRKLVERAKGILQRELNLDEEQAYLALQRQSRQKRKPMKEIAEAIVLSEEIKNDSQVN